MTIAGQEKPRNSSKDSNSGPQDLSNLVELFTEARKRRVKMSVPSYIVKLKVTHICSIDLIIKLSILL